MKDGQDVVFKDAPAGGALDAIASKLSELACTRTELNEGWTVNMSDQTRTDVYDVIVCGGRPSGFIAATAASRGGARTLLIERYGFLGGMPTFAWLSPFSPCHFGAERVVAGIPQEFVERMRDTGGGTGHIRCTNPHGSGAYLCFYDRESYKWTALQMLLEAGAELLFHTFGADALVADGRVVGVVVANKSGRSEIHAKVVVDATGDGDVAARAGAAHSVGRGEEDRTDHGAVLPGRARRDGGGRAEAIRCARCTSKPAR